MATSKSNWQRARQPEQKAERRSAILEAATNLLDAGGLDDTGLNAIARAVGISKAGIYRYFESREAILLQILLSEMDAWSSALAKRLKKLAGSGEVDAAARAFADTIAKRPRFCTLMVALASVLEHNVSAETVTVFKRDFLSTVEGAVCALAAAIPGLTEEEAFTALGMLVMASSGAWSHCNPSPVVEEVLAQPEFAAFRLDFRRTMKEHATALLRGICAS